MTQELNNEELNRWDQRSNDRELRVVELVNGLHDIYDKFVADVDESIRKDQRRKFGNKVAKGAVQWIGGSFIKTEKGLLCDQFSQKTSEQLELIENEIADLDKAEQARISDQVADILTITVDVRSNTTVDLMRRAMIGNIIPWLERMSPKKLNEVKLKLERAYPRSSWLPVEQEVMQEIYRLQFADR